MVDEQLQPVADVDHVCCGIRTPAGRMRQKSRDRRKKYDRG